ncbi:hypothetical protein PoB_006250600 [Plakobranchus ocellatus]|uniref:Uncharacterized protein n=1 Tax=Plakobranchus ocellatus TaxID=259542 RepID=A0AAV4CWC2_9GAST|nr:hypothetical protein PoB_006250600 [Plakobranchus ocellatus]
MSAISPVVEVGTMFNFDIAPTLPFVADEKKNEKKKATPFRTKQSDISPQQGDLRHSRPPSDQGAGGRARTRDRRVPADFRADLLATAPYFRHNPEWRRKAGGNEIIA